MKHFFFLFLLSTSVLGFAQDDIFSKSGNSLTEGNLTSFKILNLAKFGKDDSQIIVDDNGLRILNYKGTPLLMKKWGEGTVTFNDGKKITYPYMNYDALSDHFIIYFKKLSRDIKGIASEKLPIANLQDENILYLEMFDGKRFLKFIKLNPVLFLNKPKTLFFEYFAENPQKGYIVKSHWKFIKKNQDTNSPLYNETGTFIIRKHSVYYIKNKDGIYEKTRLNKKSILKTLKDKKLKSKLVDYAKKEKLSWSKAEDVQKILAYYFEQLIKN